jgi:hypothetical protein
MGLMSALWSGIVACISAAVNAIRGAVTALLRRTGLIKASTQTYLPAVEGGRWDRVFTLPNVAIHTHLLPDGKVLFWGRRDDPSGSMNEHSCTPYVWAPTTGSCAATPQPKRADGTTVNLFCAGHAYLPDGRLLVAGGHVTDGDGIDYAATFDHRTNSFTPLPAMNGGRWYPTATTLADGRVLVISGSAAAHGTIAVNAVPEIIDEIGDDGDDSGWQPTVDFVGLPLHPRMHVAPDGRVLMAGSNAMTYLLDTRGGRTWTPLTARTGGSREYGSSVISRKRHQTLDGSAPWPLGPLAVSIAPGRESMHDPASPGVGPEARFAMTPGPNARGGTTSDADTPPRATMTRGHR